MMSHVTLRPATPLQSASRASSASLLHATLGLKLATCLRSSSTSSSSSSCSSLSASAFHDSLTILDNECIVGPYCPRFSYTSSNGSVRSNFDSHCSSSSTFASSESSPSSVPSSHSLRSSWNPPAVSLRMPNLSLHAGSCRTRVISRCASNGAPILMDRAARIGEVTRKTKETDVKVRINLDGTGICNSDTGIPFLDHMLDQIASHGLVDVSITAKGDLHIDDHHTNEDVALAFGTALLQALGDRKGISRFGDFTAPLDEALVQVVLDLSGRPFLAYDMEIPTERVGTYDTQLVEHFFQSLVNTSGMTLHIRKLAGRNSHHIIEACFKAFARALRKATEYDERRMGSIPSSKGVLSRA